MPPTQTPALSARALTASLPSDDGRALVLDDIALDVMPSEIVDIIGPSGSGKTTMLRALARLLPDQAGDLRLLGQQAREMTPQQWRCKVALLPQKPAIVAGSVRDNLLMPWRLKARADETPPDDAALGSALAEVALTDIDPDRDAARLSVGQQARVALLRVLLTSPDVLLLDEPDAALDDASADAVRAMIVLFAEKGGAVVRVRHRGDDGLAHRRFRLAAGVLGEVAR